MWDTPACGITQFMLSPNCIWSWLVCAWQGKSQGMLPVLIYGGALEGEAKKDVLLGGG